MNDLGESSPGSGATSHHSAGTMPSAGSSDALDSRPVYVERSGVTLQHFVNRYIRTRRRPVNAENRAIVQAAVARYRGHFPAVSTDLEAFLDSILLPRKDPQTAPEQDGGSASPDTN